MPERIRILLLTTSTSGGTGRHLHTLAGGLSRERFDVEVAFGPGQPLDGAVEALGLPVHHLALTRGLNPLSNFAGFGQILRLLRRGQYDIVCTGASMAGLAGRLASRLARVPVHVHVIHAFASHARQVWPLRLPYRIAERAVEPFTTCHVAVADAMRRFGGRTGIADPARTVVIHNGIPDNPPPPPAPAMRAELGLAEGRPVVCALARLERQKGLPWLIDAAAHVIARRPEALFLVAGDGPQREALLARARRRGVESHFRFVGWRNDAGALLAASEIYCMPSLWEALPFTLLEAMAAARPVVATAVDGIPEVVEDGVTGLLVTPRDATALAGALLCLIESPALRERLGRAGRRRFEQNFTFARMIARYEELFERLAAEHERPAHAAAERRA